jgi:hypothetical protein
MICTGSKRQKVHEMSAWHPIETAPKDGSRIWAYFPFNGRSYAVYWDQNGYEEHPNWTLDGGESALLNYDPPTHWMPLPEPPLTDEVQK